MEQEEVFKDQTTTEKKEGICKILVTKLNECLGKPQNNLSETEITT